MELILTITYINYRDVSGFSDDAAAAVAIGVRQR
jgi:hypothetical protein